MHGWACQATDYEYVFKELLRSDLDFQAIAISLPGHGGSSTESYPVASMSYFAGAVLDVLRELTIESIVLVGHSMGLRVVLEAWTQAKAAKQPNVDGIVFLDGSHYKFRQSLFAFDSADARSKDLSREERAEKMAEAFTRMFSSQTPQAFRESTLTHVRGMNPEFNGDMRKSHINWDYERMDEVMEQLGKLGLPVMNLQASNVDEQNQRVPLKPGEVTRWMEFVQKMIPQVKQYVVEGSGHFPHVDQTAEVAKRILGFMRSLDPDHSNK